MKHIRRPLSRFNHCGVLAEDPNPSAAEPCQRCVKASEDAQAKFGAYNRHVSPVGEFLWSLDRVTR
jgi:hypothetical protein